MVRLTQAQRELAAEKLADVANLALGALTFGQILAGTLSWKWAIAGIGIWAVILGTALTIRESP
jgi:hypothetical protein